MFPNQGECWAEPPPRLFIIMSLPQEAERYDTLPFHFAIMSCAGGVERSLVITTRTLKIIKCFIRPSLCQVEGYRRRLGEVMRCLHSTGEVVDGSLRSVKRQGFFSHLL